MQMKKFFAHKTILQMSVDKCYYIKQHTNEICVYLVYRMIESAEPHLWVVGAYTLDIL
jgi:hypothetical protein